MPNQKKPLKKSTSELFPGEHLILKVQRIETCDGRIHTDTGILVYPYWETYQTLIIKHKNNEITHS